MPVHEGELVQGFGLPGPVALFVGDRQCLFDVGLRFEVPAPVHADPGTAQQHRGPQAGAVTRGLDPETLQQLSAQACPLGVHGIELAPFDPRFQLRLTLEGPDAAQRKTLVQALETRCPVYTTLSRAARVEVSVA